MIIFILSVLSLILGYFLYGSFVEKVWGISPNKKTPAVCYNDGIDYVKLPVYKCFFIQFLNIAGLGPIFGAILGAVYGPVCLFWIVLGSIFAGGVHDYLSGMLSMRYKGYPITTVTKSLFGKHFEIIFMMFIVVLLLISGTVFAINPAKMIANLINVPFSWCVIAIFGYYFLTTLLPIDKIIGRLYPYIAAMLIITTILILIVLITKTTDFYCGMNFVNLHPKNVPIFPLMFITIACGAISGFHATQSPIIAKCLDNEKNGRLIFYGAMITEGIIALIWATLGIVFYKTTGGLLEAIENLGQGGVAMNISVNYLGNFGGILAILSIIFLAITSGDTAFRSARITLGNCFNISQTKLSKRFLLSALLIGIGFLLSRINLTTLWLYFGWANQTLASFILWILSVYLKCKHKNYFITLVPAMFMTTVCITYIMNAKIGFNQNLITSEIIGILCSLIITIIFFVYKKLPNCFKNL